jgi:(1->4)-alpha-D-glucan 1-alpha-D-glucosylmutase
MRSPDDPRRRRRARGLRERAARDAARVPRATYRLQLHSDFTFDDASALVPYLADLGMSHVYCSPYLRARAGSRHGYDIVDHSELNPELGGGGAFRRFVETLARHGMTHLCDVVPNHMGVMGADNAWWMDVLENGRASRYADFFDIDWEPVDSDMAGRILLAVLGEHYGVALERGELSLRFEPDDGAFAVRYAEHRFPVDPRECAPLVERALERCRDALGADVESQVAALAAGLRALPARDDTDADRVATRRRDAPARKGVLARLVAAHAALRAAIAGVVAQCNGERGSFGALHALLERQAYRLAYWRVASDEINYRRFFDIHTLAALRMENDEVFDATHAFVLGQAAAGTIGGLRIDHPDGLYDPERYFERLQQRYRELGGAASLYVVVEKIRAPHEPLPASWPIAGDTGYRFASAVNALFVDGAARGRMDRAWRAFAGTEAASFDEAAYRGRRLVMRSSLAAELTVLANRALRIARADRRTRDYTWNALREALAEVVAWFPVYRTYVTPRGLSPQDGRYIDWAVGRARRSGRAADATIFEFVRALLRGEPPAGLESLQPEYVAFAMRAQQFTAPVAAKGIEDTALYTFNRLVSLNDVGGDPDRFGTTVRAFHRAAAERATRWPGTLLATSTHDNKRSEDVRARIDVLAEIPAAWRLAVRRWSRMNRMHRRMIDGAPAPSRNDEYLLYQTLVGTWPTNPLDAAGLEGFRRRIADYMVKAAREAKVRTSWVAVDHDYERALLAFIDAALRGPGGALFFDDLAAFAHGIAWFGLLNSVSTTLLKLTQPGVPDFYQGCELLDDSLVDPDNRRPVDFAVRRARLASLRMLEAGPRESLPAAVRSLFDVPDDGRAKLWTIARALALRRRAPELFAKGGYRPLDVEGNRARHVVAYARTAERAGLIVVVGRLYASLGSPQGALPVGSETWSDTAVDASPLAAAAALRNVLTGEAVTLAGGRLPLARACASFPVALFEYGEIAPPAAP